MKNRGVGALEMLAIEMKSSGTYVSRALGFKSAEFALIEAKLSDADRRVYDSAAGFWERLRSDLLNAIAETNSPSTVLRQYWSAHQRFFKQLCISLKLPKIVAEAQAALEQGKCVVIGLQATGESALEEHISQTKAAGKKSAAAVTFKGFVSVTKFILTSFIESHLPTIRLEKPPTVVKYHEDGTQEFSDGSLRKIDGTVVPPATPQPAPTGPPQPLSRLVTLRSELLAAAEALDLPAAPLDDLIDRLGGPDKVAEMTGRKGRLVRIDSTKTQYFERGKADAERETLNVQECKDFQAGRKLVGIISDAASTGISLHASRRAGNTRRRVHITIEMPWSADKCIQQLGRSHRSAQASAPQYKLVISALAGERRFAAAVARRLESLGALTRGDRRAASGADLSDFNYENKLGTNSLKKLMAAILRYKQPPPGVDLTALLKGTVLEKQEVSQAHEALAQVLQRIGLADEASVPVTKFFNRLLGATVEMQGILFGYFSAIFDADVAQARRTGTHDEGVSDIRGQVTLEGEPTVVCKSLGLSTTLYQLKIDRGLSWEAAKELLDSGGSAGAVASDEEDFEDDDDDLRDFIDDDDEEDDDDDQEDQEDGSQRTGFYRSKERVFGEFIHVLAIEKKIGRRRSVAVVSRPNTGCRETKGIEWYDLERKYRRYPDDQLDRAERDWREEYKRGGLATAKVKRSYSVAVLTGSVTPFWSTLQRMLHEHRELTLAEKQLQVVRVEVDSARIVGLRWPTALAKDIPARLEAAAAGKAATANAAEPATAVDPASLLSAKDDRIQKFEAQIEPTERALAESLFREFGLMKMFQASSKRLASKVKAEAIAGVRQGKGGKKKLPSLVSAINAHPELAMGYAAAFIERLRPAGARPTIEEANPSAAASEVKRKANDKPAQSPAASPAASPASAAPPASWKDMMGKMQQAQKKAYGGSPQRTTKAAAASPSAAAGGSSSASKSASKTSKRARGAEGGPVTFAQFFKRKAT